MLTKIIIVLFLFIIIGSLFSGLFYLVRDKGTSERTVRALTVRISLSVLLFEERSDEAISIRLSP